MARLSLVSEPGVVHPLTPDPAHVAGRLSGLVDVEVDRVEGLPFFIVTGTRR